MRTPSRDDIQHRFGRSVRRRREALGWAQEKLADRSGLHRTYIGGVERGERNISLVNIERVAEALGLTPGELMGDLDADQAPDTGLISELGVATGDAPGP